MKASFDELCTDCSRLTTRRYSTSFSLGVSCLDKRLRGPIHSIYGFVRFADEIVDSFHQFNKKRLLEKFRSDTYDAIREGISLNPILNAFQATVHHYQIDRQLIERFLKSMEMDLYRRKYDEEGFREYITGSAEAVGLMCLRVFSRGDEQMFNRLQAHAMSLGAVFQKVNFLRDLQADQEHLGRTYFPSMKAKALDANSKKEIEESIDHDFSDGLKGIKKLPRSARFGVYLAYMYYLALYKKIKTIPPEKILQTRIRIPNRYKATLWAYSFVRYQLNII